MRVGGLGRAVLGCILLIAGGGTWAEVGARAAGARGFDLAALMDPWSADPAASSAWFAPIAPLPPPAASSPAALDSGGRAGTGAEWAGFPDPDAALAAFDDAANVFDIVVTTYIVAARGELALRPPDLAEAAARAIGVSTHREHRVGLGAAEVEAGRVARRLAAEGLGLRVSDVANVTENRSSLLTCDLGREGTLRVWRCEARHTFERRVSANPQTVLLALALVEAPVGAPSWGA